MNERHITLVIAGRSAQTITIDVDSIESVSELAFNEVYERDARAKVRTKSGAEYTVRDGKYQILRQAGIVE